MYAKRYENPTMPSRVTAQNVGDVFLRHTVHCQKVSLRSSVKIDGTHLVDITDFIFKNIIVIMRRNVANGN